MILLVHDFRAHLALIDPDQLWIGFSMLMRSKSDIESRLFLLSFFSTRAQTQIPLDFQTENEKSKGSAFYSEHKNWEVRGRIVRERSFSNTRWSVQSTLLKKSQMTLTEMWIVFDISNKLLRLWALNWPIVFASQLVDSEKKNVLEKSKNVRKTKEHKTILIA